MILVLKKSFGWKMKKYLGLNNILEYPAIVLQCSVCRQKFLFEMLPGYHTQNLVSEIYRLTENLSSQPESTGFQWLDKYKSSGELVGAL